MAIIDLVSRNELVDLDGPRALNLHSLKFFVLNDQVLPFPHLVTACDVLPGDRLAGFGVDILLTIGKMNMVALGRVVLTRREHVIALEPRGRGLLGMTLRYPYEVRDEQPYFGDIPELKLPKDMMDLASHIVSNKSGHFDPSHFEDRYENALIDLLKKKEAGEKITPVRGAPPPRVVNLMDALRASIDAEKKKAPSTQARRPAKKRAGQK
jgi:DNA end-binding protein Ku